MIRIIKDNSVRHSAWFENAKNEIMDLEVINVKNCSHKRLLKELLPHSINGFEDLIKPRYLTEDNLELLSSEFIAQSESSWLRTPIIIEYDDESKQIINFKVGGWNIDENLHTRG